MTAKRSTSLIRKMIVVFAFLWLITGVIYPLTVYLVGQMLFPWQAHGSLLYDEKGSASGSLLIGQAFSGEGYFWSRPSSTPIYPYNPLASSGSNLGPTNRRLIGTVLYLSLETKRINQVDQVPTDLVMSSASGLDPHISPEAASIQAKRIADARGMSVEEINSLIDEKTEKPLFGVLGRKRVNVLLLNKALDLQKKT